jgi:multidrug resistance efflux pump
MPTQTGSPQELGFPKKPPAGAQLPAARPTPLPKRPKGRWFIGLILLTACGFVGYQVWQAFFRYRAYGTVHGHVVELSAPWDGVIAHYHVREGDTVRQGDLLLTLENTELRHRHARLGDELRVAQAELEAEAVRLKWHAAFHLDQTQSASARHFENWGRLLREQATVDRLRGELETAERLKLTHAVSEEEVARLRADLRGQNERVEKLRSALSADKGRADLTDCLLADSGDLGDNLRRDGEVQLRPFTAKIASLQAERARLDEQMKLGQIRAPANGLVVRVNRLPGERCRPAEPIVALLEEGSLQVVLYLPQKVSTDLPVEAEVGLVLDPYPGRLSATVERVGDNFEPAPDHISRHYAHGEKLLPVYLRPHPEDARWMALKMNGVVKLP